LYSIQESRAAARKLRDAAAVLFGFNCYVVSFSPTSTAKRKISIYENVIGPNLTTNQHHI